MDWINVKKQNTTYCKLTQLSRQAGELTVGLDIREKGERRQLRGTRRPGSIPHGALHTASDNWCHVDSQHGSLDLSLEVTYLYFKFKSPNQET